MAIIFPPQKESLSDSLSINSLFNFKKSITDTKIPISFIKNTTDNSIITYINSIKHTSIKNNTSFKDFFNTILEIRRAWNVTIDSFQLRPTDTLSFIIIDFIINQRVPENYEITIMCPKYIQVKNLEDNSISYIIIEYGLNRTNYIKYQFELDGSKCDIFRIASHYINHSVALRIPDYFINILKSYLKSNINSKDNKKDKLYKSIIKKDLSFKTNNLSYKDITNGEYILIDTGTVSKILNSIKQLSLVKIKSFDRSVELFGFKKIKSNMYTSNSLFEINEITLDYKCKKDGSIQEIVKILHNDRNYVFLASDLEFIYPDISILTKGYNLPKDRKIKINSMVRIKRNRGLSRNLNKNTEGMVLEFSSIGSKKYSTVVIDNKKHIINNKNLKVI